MWEYNITNKVLTINNKIDGANPLKISTNLDKHAEAIGNNSEIPTNQVCWFAIEWDPDFIPFSTSHSGGKRDLKLDQTVLRKYERKHIIFQNSMVFITEIYIPKIFFIILKEI